MTQWGIDTLFNPGKRHMDEEKRRLQSTREEVGDSSGGRRIDLESGTVTISRRGKDAPPAAPAIESGEAEPVETETAQAETAQAELDETELDESELDEVGTAQAEADPGEAGPDEAGAGQRR